MLLLKYVKIYTLSPEVINIIPEVPVNALAKTKKKRKIEKARDWTR